MSEIQVANLWFESSKSTGIVGGVSTNTYTIRAGGVDQLIINSTAAVINNISTATVSSSISVGSNVTVNTSTIFIGNSTVNSTINSTSHAVNGNNLSPFNFRNKLINGYIYFDQRNSGANTTLSTNNNVYTVDRWWGQVAANTTGCVAFRTADFPTGYQYALRVQRTSGNTGTSAITVGQVIESTNCVDLQGQKVTLSFWAKAGANLSNTTIGVVVRSGTTADEGMAKYANSTWAGVNNDINTTQAITTTWTRYTVTSAAALGTSILELGVSFTFTPTGTAGVNDWFEITGVQLEAGSVATPFEVRLVTVELALCQRYFQIIQLTSWIRGTGGVSGDGNSVVNYFNIPIKMRVTPTLTDDSTAAAYYSAGAVWVTSGSTSSKAVGGDILTMGVTNAAIGSGTNFIWRWNSTGISTAFLNSEL